MLLNQKKIFAKAIRTRGGSKENVFPSPSRRSKGTDSLPDWKGLSHRGKGGEIHALGEKKERNWNWREENLIGKSVGRREPEPWKGSPASRGGVFNRRGKKLETTEIRDYVGE